MLIMFRSPHPSRSPHPHPHPHSHLPGSRSPMTDGNMSNSLKVSIALGQKPAIIQKGPFYLMKTEPIMMSEITGATNLMASKNLEHSFQKLAGQSIPLFEKNNFLILSDEVNAKQFRSFLLVSKTRFLPSNHMYTYRKNRNCMQESIGK